MNEPLSTLLEKLVSGDDAAASEVFVKYEPYLRMVVRKNLTPSLRTKFDSMDIVQSVWADLVHGFREAGWRFADVQHLQAFLVQLTRNRFIDRLRRHKTALARERHDHQGGWENALLANDPRPDDLAQAEDLWDSIMQLCPPEHREILQMKRDGAVNADVAARTGLHEGSVRRILCNVAQKLARHQEGEQGGAS